MQDNAQDKKYVSIPKPSLPQGTRDFAPDVVKKRQYIFNTIRKTFELYGFQPLETPAMENLQTLMGKYGEEGDKLIFKILNNGLDHPAKQERAREGFEKILNGRSDINITERALKYDLTIPFARFVAMNHGTLTFPFKRYQIQPVWRADRPQKGRYREFYQCDADIIGSNALINEVELINIYNDVFTELGLQGFEIRINSRKLLTALAELCGSVEQMMEITIAIDKIDKIGLEGVIKELGERGFKDEQINIIEKFLKIDGTNEEKLSAIRSLFSNIDIAKKGIEELEFITSTINSLKDGTVAKNLIIDLTLARGLNYYTGVILEVKPPPQIKMGSIGGGGRYDDLTSLFGVKDISGVGISFGVDRIYDVMEELKLFPAEVESATTILFLNLGEEESKKAYSLMMELRRKGWSAEMFHESTKIDKQFKYAEKKKIPYVLIIGSRELEENKCTVKNIITGKQDSISFSVLPNYSFK